MDWSSSGNAETENLTSICPDNQQISHDNPVKGKQELIHWYPFLFDWIEFYIRIYNTND